MAAPIQRVPFPAHPPPPAGQVLLQIPALGEEEVKNLGTRVSNLPARADEHIFTRPPQLSSSHRTFTSPAFRDASRTGYQTPSDICIHYFCRTLGRRPAGGRNRGEGLPGDLPNPFLFADSSGQPQKDETWASQKT